MKLFEWLFFGTAIIALCLLGIRADKKIAILEQNQAHLEERQGTQKNNYDALLALKGKLGERIDMIERGGRK